MNILDRASKNFVEYFNLIDKIDYYGKHLLDKEEYDRLREFIEGEGEKFGASLEVQRLFAATKDDFTNFTRFLSDGIHIKDLLVNFIDEFIKPNEKGESVIGDTADANLLDRRKFLKVFLHAGADKYLDLSSEFSGNKAILDEIEEIKNSIDNEEESPNFFTMYRLGTLVKDFVSPAFSNMIKNFSPTKGKRRKVIDFASDMINWFRDSYRDTAEDKSINDTIDTYKNSVNRLLRIIENSESYKMGVGGSVKNKLESISFRFFLKDIKNKIDEVFKDERSGS